MARKREQNRPASEPSFTGLSDARLRAMLKEEQSAIETELEQRDFVSARLADTLEELEDIGDEGVGKWRLWSLIMTAIGISLVCVPGGLTIGLGVVVLLIAFYLWTRFLSEKRYIKGKYKNLMDRCESYQKKMEYYEKTVEQHRLTIDIIKERLGISE